MKEYIKLFDTTAEYNTFVKSTDYVDPNVSVAKDAPTVVHYSEMPNDIIRYRASAAIQKKSGGLYIPGDNEFDSNGFNTTVKSLSFENGAGVIEFNGTVTSIGNDTFNACKPLTSVVLPNSVTSIGDGAFSACSNLEFVSIPATITAIGGDAFNYTIWYSNQPDGLLYIGKIAYKYKGTMPENTSIVIREGTTSISPSAFYLCGNLDSITIPESVTSIGKSAFYNCSNLTSINIPSGITTIDYGTFSGCTKLSSISLPDSITYIDNYSFNNCTSLETLNIPNSVTSIGNNAFKDNSNLYSVTISSNITSIKYGAFDGCSNLNQIILNATTPPSLGNNAFRNIANNAVIYVPDESVEAYKVASGWSNYANNIYGKSSNVI